MRQVKVNNGYRSPEKLFQISQLKSIQTYTFIKAKKLWKFLYFNGHILVTSKLCTLSKKTIKKEKASR